MLSGSVFEAPAFVASFDDIAMMGQAIEQSRGHLGVAEDAWPFAERRLSILLVIRAALSIFVIPIIHFMVGPPLSCVVKLAMGNVISV